jgi:hypothetical protein
LRAQRERGCPEKEVASREHQRFSVWQKKKAAPNIPGAAKAEQNF